MGRKAVSKLFYCISILVTFLLAGVTCAGAFSGYVSPAKHIILTFIGLALSVLLLINLMVLIYWGIRRRIWWIVPLVAILGNWGYLGRVVRFASVPSSTTETALTLVTYNVDAFNRDLTGYTCKEMARYLQGLQADVICMQEFDTTREFNMDSVKAAFADWGYYAIPEAPIDSAALIGSSALADSATYKGSSAPVDSATHKGSSAPVPRKSILQLAVFSKYPIFEQQLIPYPDSKNCSLWCDISVNGKRIRVFNNHLQTTEVSRNKRILEKELHKDNTAATERALFKLADGLKDNFVKRAAQSEHMQRLIAASPYPVLVCGDLNSLPSSYTYRTLKGDRLQDGFQSCGHGYMYTFRYFKKLLRIDYILHSAEFKGTDYFSPEWDCSDHKPVVMRMEVR